MATEFSLAHFPGPAWKKRPDGEFLAVSDRYTEITGVNPVGHTAQEVFSSDAAEQIAEIDRAALAAGSAERSQNISGTIWQTQEWVERNGIGPVLVGIAVRIGAAPKHD